MIYPQNFENKIGFDQVRLLLEDKCLSPLGKERVSAMTFSTNFHEINKQLEQITEFIRILQEYDSFPDQYFFDIRASLKRIRVEGLYLNEQELFDLKRSLTTIRDIVSFLSSNEDDESDGDTNHSTPYPYLTALSGNVSTFPTLIASIDAILDKYGKIKDQASPELLRIRRELINTTGSISKILSSILRSAQG